MKKRIIGLIISIALLVTIFPIPALAAEGGAPAMQTSEAGYAMVKDFEGLSVKAYRDGSQWTIGYGVACDPADYPNGITEAEADALLREKMPEFETSINRFTAHYGITLTQSQFDAVASITFNLGASWINSSYRFWRMLREGLGNYTDNQIASALGVWCHVGTAIHSGLVLRRIDEIRVFLYGDYDGTSGNDFTYVIFDGNGGSVDTDIMYYRKGKPYAEFTGAAREGYALKGWYTAKTGGTALNMADAPTKGLTVYAQWTSNTAPPPTEGPVTPQSGSFSDVKQSDWFFSYVEELSAAGVLSGFADGTFRPREDVTAGQALKLVLRAADYYEQAPADAHWASGYLALALDHALLDAADVTNLDAPATRALVAKLAANALRLTPVTSGSVFADTDDGYVNALQQAGVVEGNADASGNVLFHPQNPITRAEISKITSKVMALR